MALDGIFCSKNGGFKNRNIKCKKRPDMAHFKAYTAIAKCLESISSQMHHNLRLSIQNNQTRVFYRLINNIISKFILVLPNFAKKPLVFYREKDYGRVAWKILRRQLCTYFVTSERLKIHRHASTIRCENSALPSRPNLSVLRSLPKPRSRPALRPTPAVQATSSSRRFLYLFSSTMNVAPNAVPCLCRTDVAEVASRTVVVVAAAVTDVGSLAVNRMKGGSLK